MPSKALARSPISSDRTVISESMRNGFSNEPSVIVRVNWQTGAIILLIINRTPNVKINNVRKTKL